MFSILFNTVAIFRL